MRALQIVVRILAALMLLALALWAVGLVWHLTLILFSRGLLAVLAIGGAWVAFSSWRETKTVALPALLTAIIAGIGIWQGWGLVWTLLLLGVGLLLSSTAHSRAGARVR